MNSFLKKFGAMLTCVAISGVTVALSNNYLTQIKQSDVETSQKLTDIINDWYDKNATENDLIENNHNNSNYDPSITVKPDGGNGSGGEGETPIEVPEFTSGLQAFQFAENLLNNAKTLLVTTTGTVTSMGVTQKVKNTRMRDASGNLYYNAVSASSIVKVGLEAYYNQRLFKYSKTDNVSDSLVANFSPNDDIYNQFTSTQDFVSKIGFLPDELNYIVNEDTVLKTENFSNEGTNVTFTLILDPSKSTEKYKKSVKFMSGDNNYPTFSKVELDVVIQKSTGKLISITSNNEYKALGFTCKESLTDVFAINTPVTIKVPSWF